MEVSMHFILIYFFQLKELLWFTHLEDSDSDRVLDSGLARIGTADYVKFTRNFNTYFKIFL